MHYSIHKMHHPYYSYPWLKALQTDLRSFLFPLRCFQDMTAVNHRKRVQSSKSKLQTPRNFQQTWSRLRLPRILSTKKQVTYFWCYNNQKTIWWHLAPLITIIIIDMIARLLFCKHLQPQKQIRLQSLTLVIRLFCAFFTYICSLWSLNLFMKSEYCWIIDVVCVTFCILDLLTQTEGQSFFQQILHCARSVNSHKSRNTENKIVDLSH